MNCSRPSKDIEKPQSLPNGEGIKGALYVAGLLIFTLHASLVFAKPPLGEAIRRRNVAIYKSLDLNKLPSPAEQNASQKIFSEGHWHGIELIPLSRELNQEYDIPAGIKGLLVDETTLEAAECGFLAGDVVQSVEGYSIETLKDFLKATMKVQDRKQARITLWRSAHTLALTGDIGSIESVKARAEALGTPRSGRTLTLTLRIAKYYEQLGYANMATSPPIQPGAISPHKKRGRPCADCHIFMNTGGQLAVDAGDILPNPSPIYSGTRAPHGNRGPCNSCHQILTARLRRPLSKWPVQPQRSSPALAGQSQKAAMPIQVENPNLAQILQQIIPTAPESIPPDAALDAAPSVNTTPEGARHGGAAAPDAAKTAVADAGAGRLAFPILLVVGIFGVVYLLVFADIFGNLTAFFLGACLAVYAGLQFEFYNLKEMLLAINYQILIFIVGMNIISAVLLEAGFINYVSKKITLVTGGNRWRILLFFSLLTYVVSCFMDNIATILILVPITLSLSKDLDFDPKPVLVCQVISSNLGGASTMVGDFPNMLIGLSTELQFHDFIIYEMPCCLILLFALLLYFRLSKVGRAYRIQKQSAKSGVIFTRIRSEMKTAIKNRNAVNRALFVLALVVLGFLISGSLGISPAVIAFAGGCVLLFISGISKMKILRIVGVRDVLFFACLFIMVGAADASGILHLLAGFIMKISGGHVLVIALLMMWLAGIMCAFMNAGPTAAVFIPVVMHLGIEAPDHLFWWALSLGIVAGSSAFLTAASGGPLTVNIVHRFWKKHRDSIDKNSALYHIRQSISFREYSRIGVPVMLMFLCISSIYISFLYWL